MPRRLEYAARWWSTHKGMTVPQDLSTVRVGFIGAGQMATALARGFLQSNTLTSERICAADAVPAAAERFQAATQANIVSGNGELVRRSDVVVLSVKPQQMPAVLAELRPALEPRHLVVSIAAGVTLKTMATALGDTRRIIRVMPNTPCLVGAGASAFALGPSATPADAELVQTLLSTVGVSAQVQETLLDAVTGLSGSGPAFVYLIIEALSDGGVRSGLPRELATKLAAQTVLGAAQMVLTTQQHPGALKDAVTSPGGTTIAGLHALEQAGVRGGVMDAVTAAWERSRELSRPAP
ncbi:MAG: pyrroline-5-carboxylate reductase [Planctomycetaceae bacterium]|nr:pyrroline-5-carboxylate reductase [Planctomycetaceae bacterium]